LRSVFERHAHAEKPYYFCREEIARLPAIWPIAFPVAPVTAPALDRAVARRYGVASG